MSISAVSTLLTWLTWALSRSGSALATPATAIRGAHWPPRPLRPTMLPAAEVAVASQVCSYVGPPRAHSCRVIPCRNSSSSCNSNGGGTSARGCARCVARPCLGAACAPIGPPSHGPCGMPIVLAVAPAVITCAGPSGDGEESERLLSDAALLLPGGHLTSGSLVQRKGKLVGGAALAVGGPCGCGAPCPCRLLSWLTSWVDACH